MPLDEMQNKEYIIYRLAIAKLSVGLGQSELMPVEERVAPMKQEASCSIAWSGSHSNRSHQLLCCSTLDIQTTLVRV